MTKTRLSLAVALVCAALTSACSEGVSRLSPSSPSGVDANSTSSTAGETAARTSSGGEEGVVSEWATAHGWSTAADGLAIEGTDVITAVSGLCPAATITVRGVPVALTAATTYAAPATCATLAAGTTVDVTGVLTFTATGFSVTATKIRVAGGGGGGGGVAPSNKVEGTIASVVGTCPSLTITLQGTGGVVVTNATTVFDPATACSALIPGATMEALGTRDATNQLVATKVELDSDDDDDDDDDNDGGRGHGRKVDGEGVIGAITGACPTLTAVIGGNHVLIDASTEFVGGTCATLRPGTQVKVDAEVLPNGTIVAEKIEIKKVPGRPVSGDGRVDTVVGTCPSLTMTVKGVTVTTTAATVFSGGLCSSITPGTQIDVTGDYDGVSVDATAVAIKSTGRR